jgi:hypothetical protein
MSSTIVPFILLLTVVQDPPGQVVARAAARALVEPLVIPLHLAVEEIRAFPDQRRVADELRDHGAQAVIVLACEGAGCTRVTMEVWRKDGMSSKRALNFNPRDQLEQRGRAAGLLASTLLPEEWRRTAGGGSTYPLAAVMSPKTDLAPVPRWTTQIEGLYFVPTDAVRADVGVSATVRRRLSGGWEGGALLRLERGGLEQQSGDFLGAAVGLSAAWLSPEWQAEGRFAYGARMDLLAVRRRLRHDEVNEVELHDYWALGAEADALVGYGLSQTAMLAGGLGFEALPVLVGDQEHTRAAELLSRYRFRLVFGISLRF